MKKSIAASLLPLIWSYHFALGSSPAFLLPVLPLLPLFTARSLYFKETMSGKSAFGFKLLSFIKGVIDQSKACGLSAAKVGSEAKTKDDISSCFVGLSQFFSDFSLGKSSSARMKYVHDHLPPAT